MIKILDNFVPLNIQNKYIELLDSEEIAWFYTDNIIHQKENRKFINQNITKTFAHIHTLYNEKGINSDYYNLFSTILNFFVIKEKVKIKDMIRVRIRRTFRIKNHSKEKYNVPHIDVKDHLPYKTLLYYVDDSDGDSVFFKNKISDEILLDADAVVNKRISPKQGRAIYFDGGIYHSGNCPIDFSKRTVINFDFTV
jgi:hypothetical protein